MINKKQIALIRSLRQKKFRTESSLFIAEGPKLVKEIINSSLKIEYVFATKDWIDENSKTDANEITPGELKQISALKTPQDVICVVNIPDVDNDIPEINGLTLALEDISDPGNMGTILRIADWFGISNVICSDSCVDIYNPKVVQASMGSIARVNVHYTNISSFVSNNNDHPVYVMVMDGEDLYKQKLPQNAIVIIGNESKGISSGLLALIENKITIPSYGKAESLNAAVAAGIVCAEFRRA